MSPSPLPPDAGPGPGPGPAADVADRVLDAVSPGSFVAPPEPLLAGAGPDAYTFTLATDDPYWSGVLVARAAPFAVLRRELLWLRAAAERDFAVPRLLTDRPEDGVLVFRPPGGENLTGRMTSDLVGLPDHLASFGRLHARLHNLSTDGLSDDAGPPAVPDDPAVAEEVAWLDDNRPPGAPPVLCHGNLHPVQVYVRGDDEPGPTVVADWTQARLAEPEFDVAATLVAFWTAPLYVPNRTHRALVKLARDSLASAYLAAYTKSATRSLDDDRVRYWQTFHLCTLAASLSRRLGGEPVSPWSEAANATHPAKALRTVQARAASFMS